MRKHYLDNLRWMTIALVVIYHVIYMYNGVVTDGVIGSEPSIKLLDGVQYVLYPWFMNLLFMIAGICSRFYLQVHTEREYLRSRTRKLLVPSTLGLLVFGWIQGYVNMSISNAFETISDTLPGPILYLIMAISGTGVLWFIQVLWINSVVLILVRKIEKGRLYDRTKDAGIVAFIVCGVLFYLASQVLNTPVIAVYRFGIYGYTFFLGYFVLSHEEVINKLAKYAWGLLGSAAILAGLYLYFYFGKNYATMPVVGCPLASAYGYVMSLAVLGIGNRYLNKTDNLALYMTKRSFGIYVFHYLTLSATSLYLERIHGFPLMAKYIIVLISAFAGSILLYEIISRIPILRYLVLGIKRSNKNVS